MANFIATSGDDTFNGTAEESDTVDYSTSTGGLLLNLGTVGAQTTGWSGQDTLVSIENVIGTDFNDTVFALSGGTHTLSLGGGDDKFLTGRGGSWTIDGGSGNDYFTAEFLGSYIDRTLIFDSLTGLGALTGGTTLTNIERLGITFGYGNDIIIISHMGDNTYYGTSLDGVYGEDSFTIGGFSGLNNRVYGGTNPTGAAVENDTLNLDLSLGTSTAYVTYISKEYANNAFTFGIAGSGEFVGYDFEHLNFTSDNGDNRIVVNSLPVFSSNISLRVDAAGGTDRLEMNISGAGSETQNVIWTITGSVTTVSNIGYYDHFEAIELRLGGGTNILHMGDEVDNIYSMAGSDTIGGGGGNDRIEALFYNYPAQSVIYYGGDGNDYLGGNNAADQLYGEAGTDNLYGDVGNDNLNGGLGADYLNGGTGTDFARYDYAASGVTANLLSGMGSAGEALGDTYVAIENIVGSVFADALIGSTGNNALYGVAGDDNLYGEAGADSLYGGDDNDNLNGGAGADALDGGNGIDFARYDYAASAITANLLLNIGSNGEAQGDTYVAIENIVGSAFNDALVGNTGNNALYGVAGDDNLYGEAGDDQLYGGDHNDNLNGGSGADWLDGGAGTDYARYDYAASAVIANLLLGVGSLGEALGDVYVAIENVVGSAFNDTLIGNSGNNWLYGVDGDNNLYGEVGDDRLYGGVHNDNLNGGGGADYLDGGNGFDFARYDYAASGVTANLSNPASNTGDAAGDTYTSIEGLVGSAFADTFTGNSGNNRLFGGAGADTFVFGATSGTDVIGDFTASGIDHDLIKISNGVNGSNITNYTTLTTHMAQVGADVVIDLGSGHSLTLSNLTLAQLSSQDFLFG